MAWVASIDVSMTDDVDKGQATRITSVLVDTNNVEQQGRPLFMTKSNKYNCLVHAGDARGRVERAAVCRVIVGQCSARQSLL